MIVSQLVELLQDADPEAEVLLAHQPAWPLQHEVLGVFDASDHSQPCDDHDTVDCPEDGCEPEPNENVYVVAAEGHPESGPYAPKGAWDQAVTS